MIPVTTSLVVAAVVIDAFEVAVSVLVTVQSPTPPAPVVHSVPVKVDWLTSTLIPVVVLRVIPSVPENPVALTYV